VAAVEFALIAPLMVAVVMGTIDVGQFVNVGQLVSNVSREGARMASRNGTATVAEVETTVRNYIANSFPNLSDSEVAAATQVTVLDSNSSTISGGDLTTISSGSSISVQVVFNFDAVRWVRGVDYMDGQSLRVTTVMRRE
jgi:Flp pilus assembly protein TadG